MYVFIYIQVYCTSPVHGNNNDNPIASRIPAARPEAPPFAVQGILIFQVCKSMLSLSSKPINLLTY